MCWVHRYNFWLYIGSKSSNFFLWPFIHWMSIHYMYIYKAQDTRYSFPSGAVVKTLPANAEDTWEAGSIPGSERFPGEGNGNPLQYSCLGNPMDRGAWWLQSMRSQIHMKRCCSLPSKVSFPYLLLTPLEKDETDRHACPSGSFNVTCTL